MCIEIDGCGRIKRVEADGGGGRRLMALATGAKAKRDLPQKEKFRRRKVEGDQKINEKKCQIYIYIYTININRGVRQVERGRTGAVFQWRGEAGYRQVEWPIDWRVNEILSNDGRLKPEPIFFFFFRVNERGGGWGEGGRVVRVRN